MILMFKEVPVQFWILVMLAAIAYAPARYVHRRVRSSPRRRAVTRPIEDAGWRSNRTFLWSITVLVLLCGVAIFIFTPAARHFAQSPQLVPVLMLLFGGFALFTVVGGFVSGSIEPLSKGAWGPYERQTQPRRFWASMAWNTLFGGVALFIAFSANQQPSTQPSQAYCFRGGNETPLGNEAQEANVAQEPLTDDAPVNVISVALIPCS